MYRTTVTLGVLAFALALGTVNLSAASAAPTRTDGQKLSYTPLVHIVEAPGCCFYDFVPSYDGQEICFCSNNEGQIFYFNKSEYDKLKRRDISTVVDCRCSMYGEEVFKALQEKGITLKNALDRDSLISKQMVIHFQQDTSRIFLDFSNGYKSKEQVREQVNKIKEVTQNSLKRLSENYKRFTLPDDKCHPMGLRIKRATYFCLEYHKRLLAHLNALEERVNSVLDSLDEESSDDSEYKKALFTIFHVIAGDCRPGALKDIEDRKK